MNIKDLEQYQLQQIADEKERTEKSVKALSEGKARPYEEVLEDLHNHTRKGDKKKLRRLHKELKYYGDGVSFIDRYEDELIKIYVACAAITVLALAIKVVVMI